MSAYEVLLSHVMNCSPMNSALISRLNLEIISSGGVKFLFQKIFQVEILALFAREHAVKHCLTTDNVIYKKYQ